MDFYEYDADVYSDPGFPVFYAFSELDGRQDGEYLHWHEATELIYCLEGSGTVVSGSRRASLTAGMLAVINSNLLHSFSSDGFCRYCYLLVAPSVWSGGDIPDLPVQFLLSDPEISRQMEEILTELREQPPCFRSEVCARLTRLSVALHRSYPESSESEESGASGKRMELVKAVVSYVRRHFSEPITVDDICAAVSFSRSYVCHTFRRVTNRTLLEYIQFVRCHHARTLLASGQFTIGECAEQSGFRTLSYFSRVYKKQLGVPPSRMKAK